MQSILQLMLDSQFILEVTIYMQFPIVVGLIFLSYKAFLILDAKGFRYISIAWSFNIFYLIISQFQVPLERHLELDLVLLNNKWSLVHTMTVLMDMFSSMFFILGSTKAIKPFSKFKRNFIVQLTILLASIIFCITIINPPENNKYLSILVFDLLALSLFSRYALLVIGKYNFIFLGSVLYTLTQFISVIDFNYEWGFLLGFISKFLVLYGFHVVFLRKAEEKIDLKQVNKILDQLLGSTFHELAKPINQMEENIDQLIEREKNSDKIIYNSKAASKIISINNAFQRMKAIFIASLELYEEETEQNLDRQIYFKKNSSSRTISLNNLAEQAFLSARAHRSKEINYYNEYSGNADIKCDKYEIVEAITNIINNAIEAVDSGGKILIKSKGIVIDGESYIQLGVIDNGPGIQVENLSKVLEMGFTTKKGDGHGFGLYLANKLVNKNNGILEIESPYLSSINKDSKRGTAVKLIFKKVKK